MQGYAASANYTRTRKLTILAVMSAVAYAIMAVGRIPLVPAAPFLNYDPADVVVAIAGFLFGPLSAAGVAAAVSLAEMLTVSDTGPIGFVMNVLSTGCFACTAALFYKRRRTLRSAVLGLVAACLATTAVMLLWNYLIVPLYQGIPRAAVAGMLLPAFLPFNLIKTGLNATLTLLAYKPLVRALRAGGLLLPSGEAAPSGTKNNLGVMLVAAVVLASLILVVLMLQGII